LAIGSWGLGRSHSSYPRCRLAAIVWIYLVRQQLSFTYDHRTLKTELPVRSAVLKQRTGGLVVRWVTTGESPLLYVFDLVFWHMGLILNCQIITVLSFLVR
jgi:hypothetical protein